MIILHLPSSVITVVLAPCSGLVWFSRDPRHFRRRTRLPLRFERRTYHQIAWRGRRVGRRRTEFTNLLLQISNAGSEHLILAGQIGGLGLIECRLIAETVSPRRRCAFEWRRGPLSAAGIMGGLVRTEGWRTGCARGTTGDVPGWLWHRGDGGMDGGEGDGGFGGRSFVVEDSIAVTEDGRIGLRGMSGVVFVLVVSQGVELELLLPNHLEHAIHLCFLLLFQLIVNFTQTWLALVVRIARRYGRSSSDGGRARGDVAVTQGDTGITARQFAWRWESWVAQVEVDGDLRAATVTGHAAEPGRASIAQRGPSGFICSICNGRGGEGDGRISRRGRLLSVRRGDGCRRRCGLHRSGLHG